MHRVDPNADIFVQFTMNGAMFDYAYLIVRTFVPETDSVLSQHYGLPDECLNETSASVLETEEDVDKDQCYLFAPSKGDGGPGGESITTVTRRDENPTMKNIAFYIYETDDQLGDAPKAGILLSADATKTLDSFDQGPNDSYPQFGHFIVKRGRSTSSFETVVEIIVPPVGGQQKKKTKPPASSDLRSRSRLRTSNAGHRPTVETGALTFSPMMRFIVPLIIGVVSSVIAGVLVARYYMRRVK